MRIIPRIDIKKPNLIKSIHLEGLKKLGNPAKFLEKYFQEGADELLIIDCVASLYDQKPKFKFLNELTKNIFCPITIGGGIKTLDDAIKILNSGADKIAINSEAVKNPKIIKKISDIIGVQSVVVSIEVKKREKNIWEVFIENGREPTGINVYNWVEKLNSIGCGEILITSIDQEGTGKGFDIDLCKNISNIANCPVISSGGAGDILHIKNIKTQTKTSGVALSKFLHIQGNNVSNIKKQLKLS